MKGYAFRIHFNSVYSRYFIAYVHKLMRLRHYGCCLVSCNFWLREIVFPSKTWVRFVRRETVLRTGTGKENVMRMASVFSSFRTRSPDRDRDTDRARIERLFSLADEVAGEIAREHEGLRKRRKREADDAGFLLEASANGDVAATAEKRLDTLSASVMRAESRLALLDRQLAWLDELRQTMNGFPVNSDTQQ